jgi:hypothetical protein
MELVVGGTYPAKVTFRNDHGVFVDAGDYTICLALKENLPENFYENAKGGDPVMIRIIEIDERNRYRAEILSVQ